MRAPLTLLCALMTGGCSGYADLPIRERGFAPMVIEAPPLSLPPSRQGPTRVQLRVDAPLGEGDFPKPWTVVGPPTLQSFGGRVLAWARGGCDEGQQAIQPDPDGPFRLCAAIRWSDSPEPPEPPLLTVVLESRATGRRISFIGDALAAPGAP